MTENAETTAVGISGGTAGLAAAFNSIMKISISRMKAENYVDENKYSKSIDYFYWIKMPGWNAREASAITLLLDPDRIDELSFSEDTESVSLYEEYKKRLRFLERSQEMEFIEPLSSPKEYFDYLTSCHMKLPSFSEIDQSFKITPKNFRREYFKLARKYKNLLNEVENDPSESSVKTKTSISKMLYAMAWKSFKYTHNTNNSAVTLISNAIQEAGFDGPKDDTIRLHLRENLKYLRSRDVQLPNPRNANINDAPAGQPPGPAVAPD